MAACLGFLHSPRGAPRGAWRRLEGSYIPPEGSYIPHATGLALRPSTTGYLTLDTRSPKRFGFTYPLSAPPIRCFKKSNNKAVCLPYTIPGEARRLIYQLHVSGWHCVTLRMACVIVCEGMSCRLPKLRNCAFICRCRRPVRTTLPLEFTLSSGLFVEHACNTF